MSDPSTATPASLDAWSDNAAVEALRDTAEGLEGIAGVAPSRLDAFREPPPVAEAELPIRNIAAHIKFARYWSEHAARYLRRAHTRSCPTCGERHGIPWFFTQDGYRYDRCGACGMIYIPRVLPLAVWDAYYADLPQAREWLEAQLEGTVSETSDLQNRQRFGRYYELLQRVGAVPPQTRMLDIGTYTGTWLKMAAEHAIDAWGIEGLREAVKFVHDRDPALRVEWAQAEGFNPRMFGTKFHLVTMWETLEHTIDPKRVLERAYRALEPHGWLALTVPNALNAQFSVLREYCFFAYGGYQGTGHVNLYSAATLQRALDQAGFELVHLESEYGTDWRQLAYYLQHAFDRIYCYSNLLTRGDFQQEPGPSLSIVLNWLAPALTKLENAFRAGPILVAIAQRR